MICLKGVAGLSDFIEAAGIRRIQRSASLAENVALILFLTFAYHYIGMELCIPLWDENQRAKHCEKNANERTGSEENHSLEGLMRHNAS